MSTFTPLDTLPYKRTLPPVQQESQREYLDQQLRALERSVQHLVSAVEQLQDEQALIWTALNALGQTRP